MDPLRLNNGNDDPEDDRFASGGNDGLDVKECSDVVVADASNGAANVLLRKGMISSWNVFSFGL